MLEQLANSLGLGLVAHRRTSSSSSHRQRSSHARTGAQSTGCRSAFGITSSRPEAAGARAADIGFLRDASTSTSSRSCPTPLPISAQLDPLDRRLAFDRADRPAAFPWVQQQVECVNALMERLLLEAPIVVTMFSPLTEALYFAQSTEQFLEHAQQAPALIHQALSIIAENLRAAAEQVMRAARMGSSSPCRAPPRRSCPRPRIVSLAGRTTSPRCAGAEWLAEHPPPARRQGFDVRSWRSTIQCRC